MAEDFDFDQFATVLGWNEPIIEAHGTVTLPAGMTQEEADRLIREADELENA